jgi:DNA-cytosine methyltransferase
MYSRWRTILAIDFDRWAAETYRANFPGVRVECGAVVDWIDHLPGCDVLLGGPPCQPHSHAGKRQASKDKRDCGPDFAASVERGKPRQFLMENVEGLMSSEGGRYAQRLMARLEAAGYVVEVRVQDAVSFGVPQFRVRCWWWGIRRDLYVNGMRHCWPVPTHVWPLPETPCMFGAALLPGVTLRQALGLGSGIIFRKRGVNMGERPPFTTDEPSMTVMGGDGAGGSTGAMYLKSHADAPVSVDRPATTLRSGGAGHDDCCLRIIGGGTNPHYAGEARTERDITDEPSTTIAAHHTHNALPKVMEHRWSDAYHQKHPPINPDEPSQTVQAQWHKGEPNGVLRVDAPCDTITAGSREPIQNWKSKGYRRRLIVPECLRLQSAPDDFIWPDGISKTNQYKVVGNGWASGHGAKFSEALAAADPDARTVVDLFCGGGLGACGWHGRYWRYQAREAVPA